MITTNPEDLKNYNKNAFESLAHQYKKNEGIMLFFDNDGKIFADHIDNELYYWTGKGWRVYAAKSDKIKYIPNHIKSSQARYKF